MVYICLCVIYKIDFGLFFDDLKQTQHDDERKIQALAWKNP